MGHITEHGAVNLEIELKTGVNLPDSIDLNFINAYHNPDIIEKFRKDYEYTEKAAHILFNELKKYLIICAANGKSFPPSKSIDHMWHTFILFTQDYSQFCQSSFDRYIHHAPNIGNTANRLKIEPFKNTIEALKETFDSYNEHFWEHLAPGDGDEDDDNGCTHNDCGPVDSDVHDPK